MKTLINWISSLFTTTSDGGASLRKVLAVWTMILITRAHNKWLYSQVATAGGFGMLSDILIIDYLVILLLLGLIVFQDIIKFKNGVKSDMDDKKEIPKPDAQ